MRVRRPRTGGSSRLGVWKRPALTALGLAGLLLVGAALLFSGSDVTCAEGSSGEGLELRCDFAVGATPEALWNAFTRTGEPRAYYFDAVLQAELTPGGRWRFVTDDLERLLASGEVLAVDPPFRFEQSFEAADLDDPPSRITVELRETAADTRITLVHDRFLPAPHWIHDLRGFSVQNLLHHYAQSKEHVRLTRRLSSKLFLELSPIHGFGSREAHLLDAEVVLQDIGLSVNIYRHDRHGEYLVSSAPLNGFTHREQALLALLVRYHLRGKPRLGPYESLCVSSDKRLLRALAACLRIANHLERPRAERVEDLVVEIREEEVVLRPVASEPLTLELWQLDEHQEIFRTAFGKELIVEPIVRALENDHQSYT